MKQKYLLLIIILFVFLFLFSIPSLALIPGDFGSANNGPPDGCVDFEDLMIFAMAYGSTPSDPNWNTLCDLYPDDKIDFEDLMIFAMHYGQKEGATWTVMVYLDGDNNLYDLAWLDLGEMESVGSTGEVNIVVQLDSYSNPGTYRYYVTGVEQGSTFPYYSADIVQTLSEQNMADPNVLANFINWATTNYPAEHYLLVLWNHGGGWRDGNNLTKGVIWDDTSGDFMTMIELVQGLEGASEQIDIIGFDACLMQMAEVAYEIGNSLTNPPNYSIASQELEWGYGWPYDDILSHLTTSPAMDEATLCETVVNDYINDCGTPATLSVLHLSSEVAVNSINTINNFANALMNSAYSSEIATARSSAQSYIYYPEYKDLYDFAQIIYNNVPDCQTQAQAVMDLINTLVIAEAHVGSEVVNSHGLSIFLPDSPSGYDGNYDSLQFAIDTQWDEFLLTGEGIVSDVEAITITYQSSMSKLQDKITQLEEEGKLPPSYKFNELTEAEKGVTDYAIEVWWHAYYEASGYKVYRSVNGATYTLVLEWEAPTGYDWYGMWDNDVAPGNTYSYYVTAYGDFGETNPSQIVTRDTFLPPCSLVGPPNGSVVTDLNPVFTWNAVGVSSYPYDSIYHGESDLWVWDDTAGEGAWWTWFDDMTTSTAIYNQDGYADPLVAGHSYVWNSWGYGIDGSGNLIAISESEDWYFGYGENVVFDVNAYTITYQSSMSKLQDKITQLEEEGKLPPSYKFNELTEAEKGVTDYAIEVWWHAYYEASGYKVYRSVNGATYTLVLEWEAPTGYDWYGMWDNDVAPGNTYSYYVTAYGDFGETNPSQIVTRDTFLPPCSLVGPPNGSVVTDLNPVFTWNAVGVSSYPYDSIYYGESDLWVWDDTAGEGAWYTWFDNMTTSTAIYNQDGYASPLISGHSYIWDSWGYGYNGNGNLIAISESEDWYFNYF